MGTPIYDKSKWVPLILAQVASGRSLRDVCRDEGSPSEASFRLWCDGDSDLAARYACACSDRWDMMVEDMLDIADNASNDWMENNDRDNPGFGLNGEHIQRSRVRIDTRKWIASKMNPKKYGDKQSIEHGGTGVNGEIVFNTIYQAKPE